MLKESGNDIDPKIEKGGIENIDNDIIKKYLELVSKNIESIIESKNIIIIVINQIIQSFGTIYPRLNSAKIYKIDDLNDTTVEGLFKILEINPAYSIIFIDEENSSIGSKICSIDGFSKLFKYPNVRVISLSDIEQFLTKLVKIYDDTGRYGFTKNLSSILNIIEHSLPAELRKKDIEDFTDEEIYSQSDKILKVRELGIVGSDKEVLKSIKEIKTANIDKNQVLECPNTIFCDWEDTLFINNEFKSEVLEKVLKKCIELDKSLVIWTGGDLKVINNISKYIKGLNIDICSKNDCKGLKVFGAIDDLPQKEIEDRYGVKIDNYILI